MSGTLQFIVMVDGDVSEAALLKSLKAHSCDLRGNFLEIWHNEDADPDLARNDDDGYLYYRWRVELTPTTKSVGADHQVELARALIAAFENVVGAP